MESLDGICALVSGGASEIGAEVIRALAEQGASVLAVDSSEEKIETAVADLGLDAPDEIFTSPLDGYDFFSWYDLGNLVGAYFDTLHLFVHIAEPSQVQTARALDVEALRGAEATSSDSFLTATKFLDKYLGAASEESSEGACAIAVMSTPSGVAGASVSDSLTHAVSAAFAEELTRDYSAAEKNVRVHAFRPASRDPKAAAVSIIDLMNTGVSA